MNYSTVNSTNHILLCSIAVDKVLVEKEDNIEILQQKILSLTLELNEREEKIIQLMENMIGKNNYRCSKNRCLLLIWLALQCQLVQSHEGDDPQLSQKRFYELLAKQQEPLSDDKLTQEEPDNEPDRVDDTVTSKLTKKPFANQTTDVITPSKLLISIYFRLITMLMGSF